MRSSDGLLLLLISMCAACTNSVPLPAKAIALNRDGAAALAAGDLETAEARVAVALEYNPRFTEAWVNLGLVEMRRGNFDRARVDFVKARDLNPDLPAPHHALGLLAENEEQRNDAQKYYRAALRVDPGFAPARANLARLLFDSGALEEAREQFLRLTQVAPEFAEGWVGLCESLLRLSRVGEAEHTLTAARSRGIAGAPIDVLAARLLLQKAAYGQAADILAPWTEASEPRPFAPAFAWLAVALMGRGDSSGAARAAARAVHLAPHDPVAQYAQRAVLGQVAGAPPIASERKGSSNVVE